MAKEISIRSGPELSFIIPEHRLEFENKVISAYEKVLNIKDLEQYHLPHVEVDLFNYLELSDPIHFVAARLSHENHDEQFYDNHLKHLSYDEQFRISIDYMKEFEDNKDPRHRAFYDELFYEDIASILNFHHMAFVDLGYWDGLVKNWHQGDFYKNLPYLRQVW